MGKLFKKGFKFFIINAIVFVFSMMFFLSFTKKANAATFTEELTQDIIRQNTDTETTRGSYGNFNWYFIKQFESDGSFYVEKNVGFQCHYTIPSAYKGKIKSYYASFTYSGTDENDPEGAQVNVKGVGHGEDEPDRITLVKNGSQMVPPNNEPFTEILSDEEIRLSINVREPNGAGKNLISNLRIIVEIEGTVTVSITNGTGVKSVYLSTNQDAISGSSSGTIDIGATVYGFAVLSNGYKAKDDWTLVSGTADTEDAIYRVGSITVGTSAFDTISATPKTKIITLDSNGGQGSGTTTLTYDSAGEALSTGFSKDLYQFYCWNTKADGTGTNYFPSISKSEVNQLILSDLDTFYAKWKLTSEGVVALINNIGTVEYTTDSSNKIKAARNGYEALSYQEKQQVSNYKVLENAESTFNNLLEQNAEAKIGTKLYPFLYDAFSAATQGQTIILRRDVDLTGKNVEIDKNLKLDLNGHILTTTLEDGTTGIPTILITTQNTILEVKNSEPSTGGVYGYLLVADSAFGSSYIKIKSGRLILPVDILTNELSEIIKIEKGYEIKNINEDGSPDENGFISLVKIIDVVDIGTLTEDYVVPDGQVITGSLNSPIQISIEAKATVTIRNVDISSILNQSFAGITCLGDAKLILEGESIIHGGTVGGAGIYIPSGYTLTIDGSGCVEVFGKPNGSIASAAGIGGNASSSSGHILINNGFIRVHAGSKAAGIGSSYGGQYSSMRAGDITINGGYIFAEGDDGAGIGSGERGSCGNITITGGFIIASGYSGIGKGRSGSCGDVKILDTVTKVIATGNNADPIYCDNLDISSSLKSSTNNNKRTIYHDNVLLIAGELVTDNNLEGDGWSYDKANNVLTLNNFEYEGNSMVSVYSQENMLAPYVPIISFDGDNLTINLVGHNSLINTVDNWSSYAVGIHCAGSLKFEGNGSLSLSFTGINAFSYAILSESNLTIEGPNIEAISGKANYFSEGIHINSGDLIVNSGLLYAISDQCSDDNGESFGINTNSTNLFIGDTVKLVIARGYTGALSSNTTVTNGIEGTGWTDFAGTSEGTNISKTYTGAKINGYKYIRFIGFTAEDVIALIDDIGDVEYTDVFKEKIDNARDTYNFLNEEEKELITNYDILLVAEESYAAVDAVTIKIEKIGDVQYNATSKGLIDSARESYDALNDYLKGIVPNLDVLLTKEAEYKAFDDQYHADLVVILINNIGEVKYNASSKELIDSARELYDNLNAEAKVLVQNITVLIAAEKVYDTMDYIKSLDNVKYDTKSKETIDNVIKLYNELTDDQKALITNYQELVKADNDYKEVDKVVIVITNLGKIKYDEESLNKINKAKNSKNALSVDQQKMFPGSATEVLKDYDAAYETIVSFNVIGKIQYSKECERDLKAAREKYDALTDNQKNLIDEIELKTFTDKEREFNSKKSTASTWGVILLLISLVALGTGCYFLFVVLRKKDEDDNKDNTLKTYSSVLPLVIFASYFGTGVYLAFYIFLFLAIAVWVSVVVLYLLKKKGIFKGVNIPFFNKKEVVTTADIFEAKEKETVSTDIFEANEKETVTLDFDKKEPIDTKSENNNIEDTEELDEDEVVETVTDSSGNVFKIQYNSSFTAKLILASDELKKEYSELRKVILSYKDTKSKTTWHYDTVSTGKTTLLRFGIRGKTLCVYFALNTDEFENTKYKVENITSKKYSNVPCLYRIKSDRRFEYAKELIELLAKKYDLIKEEKEIEDIIPSYEDRDSLVSRGLIKKKEVMISSNNN